MKKDDFIDAMGKIDDRYIEEADQIRKAKKRVRIPVWIPVLAAAAVFSAVVILPSMHPAQNLSQGAAEQPEPEEDKAAGTEEAGVPAETDTAQEYVYTYAAPGIPGTWNQLQEASSVRVYRNTLLSEEEMKANVTETAQLLSLDAGDIQSEENLVYLQTDQYAVQADQNGMITVSYTGSEGPDSDTAEELLSSLYDDPYVYETEFYSGEGDLLYTRKMITDPASVHYTELTLNPEGKAESVTIYAFRTDQEETVPVLPVNTILKDISHEEDVLPPAEIRYVLQDGRWIPMLTVYSPADSSYPTAWSVSTIPLTAAN